MIMKYLRFMNMNSLKRLLFQQYVFKLSSRWLLVDLFITCISVIVCILLRYFLFFCTIDKFGFKDL